MDLKEQATEQWQMLFSVRRSARYHDRRAGFFDTMHRITAVLTVSVAGFIFVDLSGGTLAPALKYFASVAGAFAILDFVVAYAQRADQHRHLRREFCELEAEMVVADRADEKLWRTFLARRIRIEIGEPPIYRALDLLCHNELMVAEGYRLEDPEHRDHFKKVRFWYRWSAHIIRWHNITSDPGIRYV